MKRERIIIMSKLAVYDKNYGEKDRAAGKYFRTDYVYRKNMWTRFYVLLGCMLIVAIYALRVFIVDGNDMLDLDYFGEFINIGIFTLVMLVIYTLIGTKVYVSEYNRSQRRLGNYLQLIKLLNDMSARGSQPVSKQPESEQEEPERGADIYYTRNDSELL
ncbi:MAG: hypothetical protein FWE20_06490 [Defluviitaleaceae bacterium]|nr:hypothetical protein [Defluviitaleaceae bacterium]